MYHHEITTKEEKGMKMNDYYFRKKGSSGPPALSVVISKVSFSSYLRRITPPGFGLRNPFLLLIPPPGTHVREGEDIFKKLKNIN